METTTKTTWLQRILFGLLIILIIGLGSFLAVRPSESPSAAADTANQATVTPADFQYQTTPLETASGTYSLLIADTPDKQQLGLGQRDKLDERQGMVFPYDQPGQRCFWMKGMRFSIDMIWLDASKEIVAIKPDVSPSTYPENFCPPQPAQYVVELNAGEAAKVGLQTGQILRF